MARVLRHPDIFLGVRSCRMGTAGIRHLASACGPPSQEILPMAFLAPIVVGTVFAFAVPNVVVAAIACLTNIWFDRRRSRRCRELDVRYELRLRRRKEGGYPFEEGKIRQYRSISAATCTRANCSRRPNSAVPKILSPPKKA